jgi:hypothetical protein
VRGLSAGSDDGGLGGTVGARAVVGSALGGGVTVVTVSRGMVLGGSARGGGGRVDSTPLLGAGPTVADVDVLSPPLTIRAVAIIARTRTPADTSATGRQRLSGAAAWSPASAYTSSSG